MRTPGGDRRPPIELSTHTPDPALLPIGRAHFMTICNVQMMGLGIPLPAGWGFYCRLRSEWAYFDEKTGLGG